MTDDTFQRRVKMIAAADAKRFDIIDTLLEHDDRFSAFTDLMRYLVSHGRKDSVETCLTLPNLPHTTPEEKKFLELNVLPTLIIHAAYENQPDILKTLMQHVETPEKYATYSLRHLFNSAVVEGNIDMPSIEMGKLLLQYGADDKSTFGVEESLLIGERSAIDHKLDRLRQYKSQIKPDSTP